MPCISMTEINLQAPITNPGKILAIGLNYGDHVEESRMDKRTSDVVQQAAQLHQRTLREH